MKETGISYPVKCHLNVHVEEKCLRTRMEETPGRSGGLLHV